MTAEDPSEPSTDSDHWVSYVLGTLIAFECTILVVSLIWL